MKDRLRHSMVTVGNRVFNWGGWRMDMPEVHYSELKKSLTSSVEVLDITSLSWSSLVTLGVPPAAIMNYSCCTIGSKVYMFGGSCKANDCYHNDLFMMDTLSNKWSQIEYSNSSSTSPMKKNGHGMMSITNNKKECMLVIGGAGPTPTSTTPNAEYIPHPTIPDLTYTNEVHMLNVSSSPSQLLVIILLSLSCIILLQVCALHQ